MRLTERQGIRRVRLLALGTGLVAAVLGALMLALLPSQSGAAPSAEPVNTGEPRIDGIPRAGLVQRATRGSWTGTLPIEYRYAWFRCDGRGAPDASDCRRIANAAGATHVARQADVGYHLRVQVTGTNAEGSDTGTSNPTPVIISARPTNTAEPTISGEAVVGDGLVANRGTWVGEPPITYSFRWLRCAATGDNCSEIAGASDNEYVVADADSGRALRVRVTARNDVGSRSAISNPRNVGQGPIGNAVRVEDLRATGDRMIVSQVQFVPNPVTSRVTPITVRVKVTDQRGRAVRGALVFVRSVPRRTTGGDRQPTAADGFVTYQLEPLRHFPAVYGNVQFFVKAYRAGDPPLGGLAGYRLVQVRVRTQGGQ